MQRISRTLRILAMLALLAPLAAVAAPTPVEEQGIIRDRKDFIPNRKHAYVPGKIIAVLVGDPQPILSTEGRGSALDVLCISLDGNSYRWVYVPVAEGQPEIGQLQIPTGEKGELKPFDRLSMAKLSTTRQWGVEAKYSLVEVEVNASLGSPPGDSFVATKMKVLDGSKEFPIKTAETIADLQKKYEAYLKEAREEIDRAMDKAQEQALKNEKATGPRTTSTLMYITWLAEGQKLRVHFLTRITDGAYKTAVVGGGPDDFPLPPPPPPPPPGKNPPQLPPPGGNDDELVLFRPAPPRPVQVRYGTEFGIEFGMAYEVSKSGTLEKRLKLPMETWKRELPKPGGVEIPPRPRPLPLPVDPKRPGQ